MIRSRSARALREVRERLRDVAAASHANVAATHDRTQRHLKVEEERLEEVLDDAQQALAAARTVYDLDAVADHANFQRALIANAAAVHETSIVSMIASRAKLQSSTRELRSAERLVDKLELERSRIEAKLEQSANDDIAARRR